MTNESLRSAILAFLATRDALTLATVGEDGEPHAAAVFFAADDEGRLVFLTDPKTRHGRDLLRDARVAGTVHADRQDWQTIRGVQLSGRARPTAPGEESTEALATYRRRFPAPFAAPGLGPHLERAQTWLLDLDWMRLIDNGRGFGHKEEWRRG